MNCEEYRELFSDFIDGELSEDRIEDFRNHIRSCEACREELARFRQAQILIKLLPRKEAPAEIWEVIEAEVKPTERKLVFFFQSVGIFESFRLSEEPSPLARIYGTSLGI